MALTGALRAHPFTGRAYGRGWYVNEAGRPAARGTCPHAVLQTVRQAARSRRRRRAPRSSQQGKDGTWQDQQARVNFCSGWTIHTV